MILLTKWREFNPLPEGVRCVNLNKLEKVYLDHSSSYIPETQLRALARTGYMGETREGYFIYNYSLFNRRSESSYQPIVICTTNKKGDRIVFYYPSDTASNYMSNLGKYSSDARSSGDMEIQFGQFMPNMKSSTKGFQLEASTKFLETFKV